MGILVAHEGILHGHDAHDPGEGLCFGRSSTLPHA